MTRKAKIFLPIAVLLIGVALAVAIVKARPSVDRQEAAALPPLVRVMEAQAQDLVLVVRSQGTVRPLVESTAVAQVAGRIDWVSPSFAEGGFFSKGDKLVQIDRRDYELAVSQAEAQVAQAQVRLQLEEAEAALAREEWLELGSGDGSPLALREPQLAEARAAIQAAEAALEKARLDLERTSIRAQFDGRIRSKLVDLGQFINRGTPVANVHSTDVAEIRLPVGKDELTFVGLDPSLRLHGADDRGPEVVLRAQIGRSDFAWRGVIVRTGSEFDANTRMLPLFARVEDPYGVNLERRECRCRWACSSMPRSVVSGLKTSSSCHVRPSARDPRCWLSTRKSRLRIRDVEIVRAERDRVLIQSGLAADDLVCVSQIETVVEGMQVRTLLETPVISTDADEEATL